MNISVINSPMQMKCQLRINEFMSLCPSSELTNIYVEP